jgi:coenzyme F420-reducing hydrogenase beta subunit
MLPNRRIQIFLLCLTASEAFITTKKSNGLTTRYAEATPIDPAGWPDRFPAKEHCSKCGLCETSFVSKVSEACAFLGEGMARMDKLEEQVHGRQRNLSDMVWSSGGSEVSGVAEEARFGVLNQPVVLAQGVKIPNAQWTGCVTGIALSMLESGMVDAVVCIASQENGEWSSSEPILAKTSKDVMRGRGVKPALAPSLKVLDEIQADKSIKKLLFCGVGCAVQGTFSSKR